MKRVSSTCGSISSLNVTWIIVTSTTPKTYKCEYKPPFSTQKHNLTTVQRLWFNFTVPDVVVCPSTTYTVHAYNLPPPPSGNQELNQNYIRDSSYNPPAVVWDAGVSAVVVGRTLKLGFASHSLWNVYTVVLRRGEHTLQTRQLTQQQCEDRRCAVLMNVTEPCALLSVQIWPSSDLCVYNTDAFMLDLPLRCPGRGEWSRVGVSASLTLLLLCCCFLCLVSLRAGRVASGSGSVLLVYPGADGGFQHVVRLLAEVVRRHGAPHVVMDQWEAESLAAQGPLRWIHARVEQAERILIVLPPHRDSGSQSEAVKHADDLLALTLTLVQPVVRERFWVVQLDRCERPLQAQLRGCRTFLLPRDLDQLLFQLPRNALATSGDATYRLRETLQQLVSISSDCLV